MRIGVISDTHGVLRPEVLERLEGVDYILHAGDIDREEVLDALRDIAPTIAVRGNNDFGRWAMPLPRSKWFELGGVKFFMLHNRMDVPADLRGAQVVIYGHTHQYCAEERYGRLWLNPGSCGWPRFRLELTMAIMTLEDGRVSVERVDLPRDKR